MPEQETNGAVSLMSTEFSETCVTPYTLIRGTHTHTALDSTKTKESSVWKNRQGNCTGHIISNKLSFLPYKQRNVEFTILVPMNFI